MGIYPSPIGIRLYFAIVRGQLAKLLASAIVNSELKLHDVIYSATRFIQLSEVVMYVAMTTISLLDNLTLLI